MKQKVLKPSPQRTKHADVANQSNCRVATGKEDHLLKNSISCKEVARSKSWKLIVWSKNMIAKARTVAVATSSSNRKILISSKRRKKTVRTLILIYPLMHKVWGLFNRLRSQISFGLFLSRLWNKSLPKYSYRINHNNLTVPLNSSISLSPFSRLELPLITYNSKRRNLSKAL